MFIGIDVAKAELVMSMLPSGERFTVSNDERGVRTLVERVRSVGPQLIVLEAMGGYKLLGVAALVFDHPHERFLRRRAKKAA